MKKKKIRYIITSFLVLSLLTAGAYAAVKNQIAYVERFETGKVDIHIQELSVMAEGETAESQKIVEANRDVSYIPRVINRSADCYVRAKVEVLMDGECERPLGIDDIYGFSGDWISKGGYFYYTKELKANQQTDIFKGLHIPEDWEHESTEGFSISVKAEAVQSANFNPDFREDLPWGAVTLEEVATASGTKCAEAVPVKNVSDVEYTGEGGFQCHSAELFDNFSNVMPGDGFEKTVRIRNSANGPMKVTLRVSAGATELNRKMNLKISADDKEVYSGNVTDADALEAIDLINIAKGKRGSVKIEMQLPDGADNSYASVRDDIIWELQTEKIPDENVQTGDMFRMWPFALSGFAAILLMVHLLLRKREDENETGH